MHAGQDKLRELLPSSTQATRIASSVIRVRIFRSSNPGSRTYFRPSGMRKPRQSSVGSKIMNPGKPWKHYGLTRAH